MYVRFIMEYFLKLVVGEQELFEPSRLDIYLASFSNVLIVSRDDILAQNPNIGKIDSVTLHRVAVSFV